MPFPTAVHEDPAPPPPALVVLAPAAWKEALAPFVAARAKELAVELVALEDVLAANEGFDAPERIKRHLHRAWKERRARYALLVGDADTFPVRFMTLDRATSAAFDTAFYPCDLYYADVARDDGAFDDWNAAKDGYRARYVGEVRGETHKDGPIDADGISYVPELAVGRFPVSDVASLHALVAKTLAWTPSAPSALLVHADGWVDERARLAAMATALAGGGFGVEELVYGKRAPTPETLATALRAQPTCVFHLGHGYSEGWAGCVDSTAPFALPRPVVAFSVGCNTAEFCVEPPYQPYVDDAGLRHKGTNAGEVFTVPPRPPACLQPGELNLTGIGERLVRMPTGGAVVYIGCDTGAQPCAVTLLEGFTRALAVPETARIGDAWRAALAHYHAAEHLATLAPTADWYPPSVFFQGMKFLYFGDPTLRVRP